MCIWVGQQEKELKEVKLNKGQLCNYLSVRADDHGCHLDQLANAYRRLQVWWKRYSMVDGVERGGWCG